MNVPEWMYVGDIVNQLEMELIIGNGSAAAGHRLIEDIARRVSEARRKHPVFAEGKYHALGVIGEESSGRSCRPWKRRLPTACIRNFST